MRKLRNLTKMKESSLLRHYVIQKLVQNYGLTSWKAGSFVRKSSFNSMLKQEPEFVMHYSANYWAKKVHKEFIPNH